MSGTMTTEQAVGQVEAVARECRLNKRQARAFQGLVAHEVAGGRPPTLTELVQLAAAARSAVAVQPMPVPSRQAGAVALLTYRQAAAELGFRSVESVMARVRAGQLTIVRLPLAPGAKNGRGSPRIASEDVDRLRRRIDAEAQATAGGGGAVAAAEGVRSPPRGPPRRSKVPTQRPKRLRHYE